MVTELGNCFYFWKYSCKPLVKKKETSINFQIYALRANALNWRHGCLDTWWRSNVWIVDGVKCTISTLTAPNVGWVIFSINFPFYALQAKALNWRQGCLESPHSIYPFLPFTQYTGNTTPINHSGYCSANCFVAAFINRACQPVNLPSL